jgi:hypothetical protein
VLHRPISRRRIYGTKLIVGLAIYLLLAWAAVMAYAIWAALPGTHASPFDWKMTGMAWTIWLAMTSVYLAAFLAGIRPAAWMGTRLSPLAGTGLVAFLSLALPFWMAWSVLIVVDVLLVVLILYTVETRDFA